MMKRTVTFALLLLCAVLIFSSCDEAGELPTSLGPIELGKDEKRRREV